MQLLMLIVKKRPNFIQYGHKIIFIIKVLVAFGKAIKLYQNDTKKL